MFSNFREMAILTRKAVIKARCFSCSQRIKLIIMFNNIEAEKCKRWVEGLDLLQLLVSQGEGCDRTINLKNHYYMRKRLFSQVGHNIAQLSKKLRGHDLVQILEVIYSTVDFLLLIIKCSLGPESLQVSDFINGCNDVFSICKYIAKREGL